jgi:DNA polymerase-3 subunit epsilon
LGYKVELNEPQAQRLRNWRVISPPSKVTPLEGSRFIVVDVETSGLNLASDRLIAIGAVAVVNGRLDLNDSFEVVLHQPVASSKDNILIHGIGASAQQDGLEPAAALLAFLEYLGKDALVAFHVTFDATMLRRAMRKFLGFDFKHPWLDLAYAVPGLYPAQAKQFRALDDWLSFFRIQNSARHNALADAVSTAQLFMITLKQARQHNITTYQGLQELEKAQRWINGES